jgi:nicotinate-nucleotide adenylyltransferase
MGERVGLFGGTFDPPHFGHLAVVRAAARCGRFDVIEVTVAGDPYRKSAERQLHPATVRLAMARVAFEGLDLVRVSDREIRRSGPTYTIDTVRELLGEGATVDLIIGADLVDQLDSWHRADELRSLVRVAVVPRPGTELRLPEGWEAYQLDMEPVELSSTFLRDLRGENLRHYLPEAVIPLFEDRPG